jgi:hypothetical protein
MQLSERKNTSGSGQKHTLMEYSTYLIRHLNHCTIWFCLDIH